MQTNLVRTVQALGATITLATSSFGQSGESAYESKLRAIAEHDAETSHINTLGDAQRFIEQMSLLGKSEHPTPQQVLELAPRINDMSLDRVINYFNTDNLERTPRDILASEKVGIANFARVKWALAYSDFYKANRAIEKKALIEQDKIIAKRKFSRIPPITSLEDAKKFIESMRKFFSTPNIAIPPITSPEDTREFVESMHEFSFTSNIVANYLQFPTPQQVFDKASRINSFSFEEFFTAPIWNDRRFIVCCRGTVSTDPDRYKLMILASEGHSGRGGIALVKWAEINRTSMPEIDAGKYENQTYLEKWKTAAFACWESDPILRKAQDIYAEMPGFKLKENYRKMGEATTFLGISRELTKEQAKCQNKFFSIRCRAMEDRPELENRARFLGRKAKEPTFVDKLKKFGYGVAGLLGAGVVALGAGAVIKAMLDIRRDVVKERMRKEAESSSKKLFDFAGDCLYDTKKYPLGPKGPKIDW